MLKGHAFFKLLISGCDKFDDECTTDSTVYNLVGFFLIECLLKILLYWLDFSNRQKDLKSMYECFLSDFT